MERQEADWAEQWRGVWTSTKDCEDWAVIERVLVLQGIPWMIRKVGMALTPQDGMEIIVQSGVPTLHLTRLSLPKILGQPSYKYPLDGRDFTYEDSPFGELRTSARRVEGAGNLIHFDVASVGGKWTTEEDWSIEEESGELYLHRRTVFKSGGETLKVQQKFKRTGKQKQPGNWTGEDV